MPESALRVALVAIAQPTFDVPLAQSVANCTLAQLPGNWRATLGPGADLLMDEEAARQAIAGLLEETIDVVVFLQASFADSAMAASITETLVDRRIPFLLWAVPDRRDGGRLRLNSLCGINLLGHALSRRGIDYAYVHQPADSPAACRACDAPGPGRTGRIPALWPMPVSDSLVNHLPASIPAPMTRQISSALLGAEVFPLTLETILEAARHAQPEPRAKFIARTGQIIDNLAALDPDAVGGTAGVFVALQDAINTHELSGVAVRCWPEFFTELGCAGLRCHEYVERRSLAGFL